MNPIIESRTESSNNVVVGANEALGLVGATAVTGAVVTGTVLTGTVLTGAAKGVPLLDSPQPATIIIEATNTTNS